MRKLFSKTILLSGLAAALLAAPAFADEAGDITKMIRAGQYPEALAKADATLAQRPKDAQVRFLKGVILTEQGKSADAIGIFTKLTDDYPDLPEPYNNLAVLYASSGQYEKARAALDMAIRTNPSYATAYENLGDIHAKLASQAYDKALQLDSANSTAKSKLTLLRSLGANATTVAKAGSSATKVAAAQPPVVAQVAQAKPEPVAPKVEPKPVAPKVEPKPEPKVEPKAESKPQPKAEPAVDNNEREILNTVHAWAKAWSAQDMKAYLAHYGNDFQPPKGQSRAAWAEERRARIVGKGRITVRIESASVSVKDNTATVKFRQIYDSDRLKADSRKTLVLTRQGGKWQIKQEHAGG
ncbi:MAG: tetratricopeptide repeat protein [Proteobacteria bacterium]|nr:tetratricopeptide repeat protein [Pseudomonadota bacterium]